MGIYYNWKVAFVPDDKVFFLHYHFSYLTSKEIQRYLLSALGSDQCVGLTCRVMTFGEKMSMMMATLLIPFSFSALKRSLVLRSISSATLEKSSI